MDFYQKMTKITNGTAISTDEDNPHKINGNGKIQKFVIDEENGKNRTVWTNQFEFLFSCIAMSVGLG